jgi:zinc protease
MFFSNTGLDEMETHRLRAATTVLETRLRDVLREELGGTYSVGVGYSDTSPQPGYGTTTVQFGSSPENADRLANVVMAELEKLRTGGPTDAEVQSIKETEKRELETSVKQNGYWLNSLQAMHLLERDPRRILQRMERAESLSKGNIHAALRKYFPTDRYAVVTLMPEADAARPLAAR